MYRIRKATGSVCILVSILGTSCNTLHQLHRHMFICLSTNAKLHIFELSGFNFIYYHGLQSRPPSPKRAERKVRRRSFREAGSGQNNGTR